MGGKRMGERGGGGGERDTHTHTHTHTHTERERERERDPRAVLLSIRRCRRHRFQLLLLLEWVPTVRKIALCKGQKILRAEGSSKRRTPEGRRGLA